MGMAKVLPSEDMIKNAGRMDLTKLEKLVRIFGPVVAAGAVISPIATHCIGGAVQKRKEQKEMNESWQRIIAKVPEMNNEDARETFESMYDLSPSIMKHPRFAIPAIRTTEGYDTGGIPIDLASKLVSVDAARTKGSPDFNTKLLSGISTGLNIMKGVGDIGSGKSEEANQRSEEAARMNTHKRLADYIRMPDEQRQEYNTRALEEGLEPIS